MRHRLRGRQLNRTTNQRKALLRGLAKDLIRHEQITTTLPKAKDLRPFVEKLVTLGRRGGLHVYRQALSVLGDNELARKLTGSLAERYRNRAGGYTRIIKAGFRYGDNAPLAVIEFIERDVAAKGAGQKIEATASDATVPEAQA
ncbi:50S ribosomal protein L17 [Candidatus Paracaedimonas acanthamoebae]|nr:50S ribosomal protein L17 [Candidatus Paracaedimonas acanthamoebae]